MSMFCKPGDSSSSSSDDSYDDAQNDEIDGLAQDSVLSRINTLDSAISGGPAVRNAPPRLEVRQSSAQNVRDLLLHSLLEERTIRQVAEQLNKDVSDPEVQRLGREAYQEIARQISNNVDDSYASNEMQPHRATANDGINRLTRTNLSKLSVVPEGSTQALTRRPLNEMAMDLPQQPALGFDVLSGIPAPTELHLRGYPGLQVDRYLREFSELEVVGKGGYGRVYKAKHKLDGSLYAVKRIPVSSMRVARIQEQGPQELESMLEEVRSLARFDHNNIVRYHNAWLEYTTVPTEMPVAPPESMLRNDRLLENAAAYPSISASLNNVHSSLQSLDLHDPLITTDPSYGAGIVFESSDPGYTAEESKSESDGMSLKEKLKFYKRKNRRGSQASQATIATMSSSKSRMSAVEDVDEDEEDDDVEMIPRSHMPYSQEPASELSEGMISHSDVPGHLISAPSPGPVLTLNVQMSLCESNLAAFLSSERSLAAPPIERHCFHPCLSLELLSSIVSGVEYLHSRGVVHRDLKPANVFLSLSTDRHPPYGSVDISSCKPCPARECVHVTPRIGDFGLVAALDNKCMGGTKPVGTEFYRPQTNAGVSEKLDVFALGVMAFEMLQAFGTRMERVAALTELRRGVFPAGFAAGVGEEVQKLVAAMVQTEESKGLSCSEVKAEIGRLVQSLQ